MYLEFWMFGMLFGLFAFALYYTWKHAFQEGDISCLDYLEEEGIIELDEE